MAETARALEAQTASEDLQWSRSAEEVFSPISMTSARPFCAGVLIVDGDRLLVTLSAEGCGARDADGASWFVGGVGGGQEPNETLWDCAQREASEELGVSVKLRTSSVTYLHDINTDAIVPAQSSDEPAPFILQRILNEDASKPFRPDLPAGPYTYFGLFLARLTDETAMLKSSDDDVAALVWLPLSSWHLLLNRMVPFETLLSAGASIAAGGPISPNAEIHLKKTESLRVTVPLLAASPDH